MDSAGRTGGRRTKTSNGGNRGKGYAECCGARYGELSGACKFDTSRSSMAGSLERVHNFDVTARILLNGDFMFRAVCDCNELRVAKIARSATSA